MNSLKGVIFLTFIMLMISSQNIKGANIKMPFPYWTKDYNTQNSTVAPSPYNNTCPTPRLSCSSVLHTCWKDDDCAEYKKCCQVQCIYVCFPHVGKIPSLTSEELDSLSGKVTEEKTWNKNATDNSTEKYTKLTERLSTLEMESDVLLGLAITSIIISVIFFHVIVGTWKKLRANSRLVMRELVELNNTL